MLQGLENQNDREAFEDHPQQNINNQLDDQFANVNMTDNSIENDTFDSSSCPNEIGSQQKEEPLLIKIRGQSNNIKYLYRRNYNSKNGGKTSLAFGKVRCQHFYPNKSKEEILANRPSSVPPTEWANFVTHYKDDKMKKISEQNTRNRRKLKVSHARGTKSNARRGHQMELQLNRPVCRGEVLLSTLIKKNGNYVNDKGKTIAKTSWSK
ncbi:hypothetical protein TSUD_100270 [Trifolium subterraneum]|uniref:Uncharacterized protein n=1 Tax=Trifolium subterraneum TaxID=3900 RepID=A0A2Z6P9C6_TRISU|nr:hypothetical protein TSUD_100270 [Trifolium subterraneum]